MTGHATRTTDVLFTQPRLAMRVGFVLVLCCAVLAGGRPTLADDASDTAPIKLKITESADAKVTLDRALALTRERFPAGLPFTAQYARIEGAPVINIQVLTEEAAEGATKQVVQHVRVDGASEKIADVTSSALPETPLGSLGQAYKHHKAKLIPAEQAIAAALAEAKDGKPIDVTLGGASDEPTWLVMLATGERLVTIELGAITGNAVARFDWEERLRKAHDFFKQYETLVGANEATLTDLYADTAAIRVFSRGKDGLQEEGLLPGSEYKRALQMVLPMLEQQGAKKHFEDVRYAIDSFGVRIFATAKTTVMKSTGPAEWVMGPDPEGQWRVLEEVIKPPTRGGH